MLCKVEGGGSRDARLVGSAERWGTSKETESLEFWGSEEKERWSGESGGRDGDGGASSERGLKEEANLGTAD